MAVFVDTSAIFATFDTADRRHEEAQRILRELEQQSETLFTTNYVVVETMALLGKRLGFDAARAFQIEMVPILNVHWIDKPLHEKAVAALLTAGRRNLSLVDCVSFEVMREMDLDMAFAFDAHFTEQGLRLVS